MIIDFLPKISTYTYQHTWKCAIIWPKCSPMKHVAVAINELHFSVQKQVNRDKRNTLEQS